MEHGFVINVRPFRHVTSFSTHIYNCRVTSPNGWQASGLVAMKPWKGTLARSGSRLEDWVGYSLRRGLLEHVAAEQLHEVLSLVEAEIRDSNPKIQKDLKEKQDNEVHHSDRI